MSVFTINFLRHILLLQLFPDFVPNLLLPLVPVFRVPFLTKSFLPHILADAISSPPSLGLLLSNCRCNFLTKCLSCPPQPSHIHTNVVVSPEIFVEPSTTSVISRIVSFYILFLLHFFPSSTLVSASLLLFECSLHRPVLTDVYHGWLRVLFVLFFILLSQNTLTLHPKSFIRLQHMAYFPF